MFKKSMLSLAMACLLFSAKAQEVTVNGKVYEDSNKNGVWDPGEKGISNIAVSNQREVVLTDRKGNYSLKVDPEKGCIFVSKSASYAYPLNEYNIPKRHYIHRKDGSPSHYRFDGFEAMGEWPQKVNFALHPQKKQKRFNATVVADPQTYTEQQVDWYARNVVSLMSRDEAKFYIALGDIAWDNLETYKLMNSATKHLGRCVYGVVGNHDINFLSESVECEAETFKKVFGPDYYSFDEGEAHFVVLNDISYHGWQKESKKRGYYHGAIDSMQLEWLRNDLALVPKDKRVVLAMHIPLTDLKNKDEVYALLKDRKHLLALSGHKHKIRHDWLEKQDSLWKGKLFHHHVCGSGCGMRYKEAKDPTNVPMGLNMDGSPQGYYEYQFDGVDYNFRFQPAKRWEGKQMHIASPTGRISSDSIQSVNIVANLYNCDIKSKVKCWINGEGPYPMQQYSGKDPYYSAHMWMSSTGHLWKMDFPKPLPLGTHLIRVIASDNFGNEYHDEMLFTITE